MIAENNIDDFLCVERNLKLEMVLGEYKISIVPYKAHFLVTVYENGIEIYQDSFNYWSESFDKFKDLCDTYCKNVFLNRIQKQKTETNE